MSMCNLRRVGRIQFLRSPKSVVLENSIIQVKCIVCSEFNDPLDSDLLQNSVFTVNLVSLAMYQSNIGGQNWESIPLSIVKFEIKECEFELAIQLPPNLVNIHNIMISIRENANECSICNQAIENTVNGVYVMPVISEEFTIVPSLSSSSGGKALLGTFRLINCTKEGQLCDSRSHLLIHEKYGETLGAHLYDSSIVLLRYFESIIPDICNVESIHTDIKKNVIVELGAGCGLNGLWFGRVVKNVTAYLTDKICQKILINENIISNRLESSCKFAEVEWNNDKQIKKLIDLLKVDNCSESAIIDTIIATDVLYDRDAVTLLFNTIRKLATPNITQIFIAQKLRKNTDVSSLHVDIRNESDFQDCTNVYEEADVIIWKFKLSSNCI